MIQGPGPQLPIQTQAPARKTLFNLTPEQDIVVRQTAALADATLFAATAATVAYLGLKYTVIGSSPIGLVGVSAITAIAVFRVAKDYLQPETR